MYTPMKAYKKLFVGILIGSFITACFATRSHAITPKAAEALGAQAGLSTEQVASFVGSIMDQAAKQNLDQVYLPNAQSALQVSKDKNLNSAQKQLLLNDIIKQSYESLEFHKSEFAYRLIAPFVNYKLEQFKSAVAAQDFKTAAQLSSSAVSLLKGLTK